MKKWIIIIGLVSLQSKALFAQQKAIAKVLETQRIAWNNGDLKAFMQTYWHRDSLVFVGKNGVKYGWQTTYDNYLKSYPNKEQMGVLTFNLLKIKQIDRKDAYIVGTWYLQRSKDEPHGIVTLLLHKFNDGWKITLDHTQ